MHNSLVTLYIRSSLFRGVYAPFAGLMGRWAGSRPVDGIEGVGRFNGRIGKDELKRQKGGVA